MRRRLVVVLAGAVAGAVVVVGLGTLALTRIDARHRNEDDLARRLGELAVVIGELRPVRAEPVTRRLAPVLDVDNVRVIRLDTSPPEGLEPQDIERLRAGETVSSRHGDTAYAAAPLAATPGDPPVRALLATDSIDANTGAAGGWFVVAGAGTVVLGALIALRVARSLAEPLTGAETAARQIAEGDLAARVPEPSTDDELARLVRSINGMAASLERAQQTERDFLLSVSHDLRTPLTSISGWAEALADEAAPDPKAAGATILTEAGRLDRLVRDLLDLARLKARAFTLEVRPIDLRDVATGTTEGLRPDLEDAGLLVTLDVPDEPVLVNGDPDRLAQIAGNLVENAGRHATGQVRVSVTTQGDDAILEVHDDGPGIPPDEQPKVFKRLHSSPRPAARPGTGTGLGLAIVRELARAMGGDATAADSPDSGAHLVVRLPRLDSGAA